MADPEHDPITDAQRQLCNEIAARPLRITSGEMTQMEPGRGRDVNFLFQAGYINSKPVYVSHEPAKTVFELTRSSRPLPTS